MLDDDKRLLEELQEKLKEVELKVEDLEESGDSEEITDDPGFIQVSSSSNQFFLHWININETNFSNCDSVDSVEKAQIAFKEASEYRDNPQNDKREVMHGDIMVLLCNTSKEDDGAGNISYPDACYYVGMCVFTDGVMQEENPVAGIKIASSTVDGNDTVKQFIAWDTCGSGEAVDTEGHTGDVIESVLGTPTHTATCSDDQTILNLTFPVIEKTLTFQDGLLKSVSSPTQGTPITSTIYLPCCCDEECPTQISFSLTNTNSGLSGYSSLPSTDTADVRDPNNNDHPNCYGIYDGTATGWVIEFTNRINNTAELRFTTTSHSPQRSLYFTAVNNSDDPFTGTLNFDNSRNFTGYTGGTATIS
tara:strand:+ start:849 stop:1934 length:1086 start_codon:yes stop_codon:yes gene_type:complete